MSCNYNWYFLPNIIKKEILTPLKSFLSEDNFSKVKDLYWYNLPLKLNSVFKTLLLEYTNCSSEEYSVKYKKFYWFDLNKKVSVLCDLRDTIISCNDNPQSNLRAFQISQETAYALGQIDCERSIQTQPTLVTAYHNGLNSLPSFGDIVYLDASGTTLYPTGLYVFNYVSNTSYQNLPISSEGLTEIYNPQCL